MTIKEAREKKVPALDDEMAKDTGEAETLEGLRGKVRERLLEADERRIKGEMTRALVKELVKRNEFAGRARADRALRAADRQPRQAAAHDDGHRRRERRRREDARGGAQRGGGGGARLDPDPGDRRARRHHGQRRRLQKRVAELAAARNENPKQLRAELEKDHRIHQIETQIREQKALDMLIAQAKITDEEAPSLIVTPEQAKREAAKAGEARAQKAKKEPNP